MLFCLYQNQAGGRHDKDAMHDNHPAWSALYHIINLIKINTMKKKYTKYTASLLIGLLSLSTLSSCVQTGRTLGMTNNAISINISPSNVQDNTSQTSDAESGNDETTSITMTSSNDQTNTKATTSSVVCWLTCAATGVMMFGPLAYWLVLAEQHHLIQIVR